MNPRDLAIRAAVNTLAACACLLMLVAITLRSLLIELADDVRASRNESRNRGEPMLKNKTVREYNSTTALRIHNATLAAKHGDTSTARAVLSDARQLATEIAMPMPRRQS